MERVKLTDLINIKYFRNKKILVVENKGVNVDFLLRDVFAFLENPSLFSWNENVEHYKIFFNKTNCNIKSIYDDVYRGELISDHTNIGENVFETNITSNICIYRDGTANKKDWYSFDLIINVLPPESGVCTKIDGFLIIRTREKTILKIKYKVKKNETIFFNF